MDLLNAAQALVDVLTAENDALKRTDFVSAVALIPAKDAALAELAKQPNAPALAPLADLMQQMRDLATENQVLLERAITVQTRVVRIVARAYTPPSPRYNGHGGPTQPNRATALALSTSV